MKISARNSIPGKVTEIKVGATVMVDVGGTVMTASITNEAVADLGLKVGDSVHAIIKSSDVMIGIP